MQRVFVRDCFLHGGELSGGSGQARNNLGWPDEGWEGGHVLFLAMLHRRSFGQFPGDDEFHQRRFLARFSSWQ